MASEQITSKHYFEKLPVLSNDRLVLKEIEPHDAKAIIEISVYDGIYAKNEAEAIHFLEKINHDVARGEALHWGIFLKNTSELTGTCGYYRGFANNSGEIGYVLHPSYRGLGIMTEAVKLIVDFGFDKLNLYSVIAYTDPANSASQAVLQRVGFKKVSSEDADLKFEKRHP
jgi:[ribosomal protein S5]-alanine N-acetyltransferase